MYYQLAIEKLRHVIAVGVQLRSIGIGVGLKCRRENLGCMKENLKINSELININQLG